SRAQSWVLQDHILRDNDICGMDDDYVSDLSCLRVTISSFDFCGFTNKDTAPSKSQQTLANVIFSKMVKDMKVHLDMTMRQKVVFDCLRAPHAQDFLLAILTNGLSQHKSPVEYRAILKDVPFNKCRRVGISAKKEAPANFLTDPVGWKIYTQTGRRFAGQAALKAASCKVTKHEKTCIENQHVFIPFAFDTFGFLAPKTMELLNPVQRVMHNNVMTPIHGCGDHVEWCAGILGIKHQHNIMHDALFNICLWYEISASKEVDIGLGGGRDKPLRLTDMLLNSWDGGFDVCVDLTGSPLTQTRMIDFVPGRAVTKVAQRKRVNYYANELTEADLKIFCDSRY
nr:putative reverse transcriptase domain-containing protein [Tanacetum cinerariifolium]